MVKYFISRLPSIVLTLLILTLGVFGFIFIIPGSPVLALVNIDEINPEYIAELEKELGFDRPVYIQYLDWLGRVLRGDLGTSLSVAPRIPVAELLLKRFFPTLWLAIGATVIATVLGLLIAVLSYLKRNTFIDNIVLRIATISAASFPNFWLAIMFIYVFGVLVGFDWAMSARIDFFRDPVYSVKSLILPSLTLGLPAVPLVARVTRGQIMDILNSDFIKYERVLNLPWYVVAKDAIHNGVLPIITILGYQFGLFFRSTFLIEVVFGIQGLGFILVSAANMQDYQLLQGIVLILGAMFILSSFTTEIFYSILDPRVSIQGRKE